MDRSRVQGFSLTELLITLAIVAVLASITVPAFSGFVTQSRRGDAMGALLSLQLAQERWRANNPRYAADLASLGRVSSASSDGFYRLRVRRADSRDFLVVAEPVGVQRDDDCGVFAVDASGPHHGAAFAAARCWKR